MRQDRGLWLFASDHESPHPWTPGRGPAAAASQRPGRSATWCCGWRRRTRPWDTAGCTVSCPCGCRKPCHPHLSWDSCSRTDLGGTAAGGLQLPAADQAPARSRRPPQRIRASRVEAQVKTGGRVLEPHTVSRVTTSRTWTAVTAVWSASGPGRTASSAAVRQLRPGSSAAIAECGPGALVHLRRLLAHARPAAAARRGLGQLRCP